MSRKLIFHKQAMIKNNNKKNDNKKKEKRDTVAIIFVELTMRKHSLIAAFTLWLSVGKWTPASGHRRALYYLY